MGEAYFLRGFIYHELLRLYGMPSTGSEPTGVPLINKSLTLSDNFQIPRAKYDEVVDFIIADLDKATSLLPKKGLSKQVELPQRYANALKSRVLLYASRWQAAADLANKVINTDYTLFNDYRTLFLTKNNSEIILRKNSKRLIKCILG
jgi:hypothetical protein